MYPTMMYLESVLHLDQGAVENGGMEVRGDGQDSGHSEAGGGWDRVTRS